MFGKIDCTLTISSWLTLAKSDLLFSLPRLIGKISYLFLCIIRDTSFSFSRDLDWWATVKSLVIVWNRGLGCNGAHWEDLRDQNLWINRNLLWPLYLIISSVCTSLGLHVSHLRSDVQALLYWVTLRGGIPMLVTDIQWLWALTGIHTFVVNHQRNWLRGRFWARKGRISPNGHMPELRTLWHTLISIRWDGHLGGIIRVLLLLWLHANVDGTGFRCGWDRQRFDRLLTIWERSWQGCICVFLCAISPSSAQFALLKRSRLHSMEHAQVVLICLFLDQLGHIERPARVI